MIIIFNEDYRTNINFIDEEDMQNLYTYESDLVSLGQKKFELKKYDVNNYLFVVSVKIRNELV